MARINPRLARDGRPLLRAFLGPLLRSHNGFGGLGHVQAGMEHLEPAHRQYAERYARMLRPGGPFPEASTLWRLEPPCKSAIHGARNLSCYLGPVIWWPSLTCLRTARQA